MFSNWRELPPVFVPALSCATLVAKDAVFWLGDGQLEVDDPSPLHWHDTYELGYILSGHGVIVVGDTEYEYAPGQLYIIDNEKPHMGYSKDTSTSMFVVHFQPALLTDSWIGKLRTEAQLPFVLDFSQDGPLIPSDDPVLPLLGNLMHMIRRESMGRDEAWEVIVSGLILQIVGILARRLLHQNAENRPDQKKRDALQRIRPCLQIIEAHFAESLTLNAIAQAAYLSTSHCCTLFQVALNTTPIAYRNHRRLNRACQLLQSTDESVSAIANQVGFSSVQEFNRLFLREVQMTPTQFRQRFFSHASFKKSVHS
jgi:AraC family transcriptional regulator, melibiose operon regulatory protein